MYTMRTERFLVTATLIDYTNGDSLDISSSVIAINVKKDFFNLSFPLYVVDLRVTEEIRSKLRDNEIALDLKVDKYVDSDSEQTEETETPVITGQVLDALIRPYKKPFTATNMKTEDAEDEQIQTNTLSLINYQLNGIPEQLIKKNSKVVNEIYESATITDIAINILSKTENGKIFMDTSDNRDREENLLVPPLNIIPAIKYLQDYYGIYNSKLGIFFDYNGTYLFKHYNKNRSYTNTFEIIIPNANDINNDNIFIALQVDEEDKNVRFYLKNTPTLDSSASIYMDYVGQTAVFNSYDQNFENIKRIYSNDTNNEKVRYFWNSNQNKILEEEVVNQAKLSEITNISLMNIDPNYFNIDTLYTITAPQSYINGIFTPISCNFSFNSKDRLHFTSMINITLVKL